MSQNPAIPDIAASATYYTPQPNVDKQVAGKRGQLGKAGGGTAVGEEIRAFGRAR
jgi:hypothetical protein